MVFLSNKIWVRIFLGHPVVTNVFNNFGVLVIVFYFCPVPNSMFFLKNRFLHEIDF